VVELPPVPEEVLPKPNRKERRKMNALERARLKHDKFVIPKGQLPPPKVREPLDKDPTSEAKPEEESNPLPVVKSMNFVTEEEHHDNDELVLYREEEFLGQFCFRDTILDQLDRYFVYLERMRIYDSDSYEFYRRVGATIVPYCTVGYRSNKEFKEDTEKSHKMTEEEIVKYKAEIKLPTAFGKMRPTFGCFSYGTDPLTEKREQIRDKNRPGLQRWIPKFMYFVKYERPPCEFQPMTGGDVYKMTVWWDRMDDKHIKHGVPQEYGVFINKEGTKIQILKTRRRKNGNMGRWHEWRLPDIGSSWEKESGVDTQSHLSHLFCETVSVYDRTNYSMVRIAASKGNKTAVFGVDISRMGYFFQDRDIKLTTAGSRKRVFHIVRPHKRTTKKGDHYVKLHFRGEREFDWAGYKISITVPGLDHFMMPEIDLGFIDSKEKTKEKLITQGTFGKNLVKYMKTGVGARH
jgi:hypothetical protein